MRMNVYIPAELKQRMDEVGRLAKVNWSEVACRAFAYECNQHFAQETSMKPVGPLTMIELLRKEAELNKKGRPSIAEWKRSGKALLDYPTGFGRPLGDLTGEEVEKLAELEESQALSGTKPRATRKRLSSTGAPRRSHTK